MAIQVSGSSAVMHLEGECFEQTGYFYSQFSHSADHHLGKVVLHPPNPKPLSQLPGYDIRGIGSVGRTCDYYMLDQRLKWPPSQCIQSILDIHTYVCGFCDSPTVGDGA